MVANASRGRAGRALALALGAMLALLVLAARPGHAADDARTALVIGNANYSYGALANAANDANDMAEALRGVGFEVLAAVDADHRAMDEAIEAFGAKLAQKGGVGLFFFAGHGVQLDGTNYLLPIGEALTHERDVKYEAVNVGRVLDAMDAAGNGLNIVILDACRNNPLQASGRSPARGLTRVESGAGMFISFSTELGAVALDGEGRNSPFTKHLVEAIATPNLTLEQTFKETLKGVHVETNGQQTPWISSSFYGDFIFNPSGGAPASPPGPIAELEPAAPASAPPRAEPGPPLERTGLMGAFTLPQVQARTGLAGVYRAAGTNPNGSTYTGMVAIAPDRAPNQFRYTWWIGSQIFHGVGRREGRWLNVDWGQSSPVIYTRRADGTLDGLWADGSATETLSLYALAAERASPVPLGGRYAVQGRNPNASRYSGQVEITGGGGQYQVFWRIGSSQYSGRGVLDGNVLTVDWGDSQPVIYAVAADGVLSGLWSNGSGEEELTPRR